MNRDLCRSDLTYFPLLAKGAFGRAIFLWERSNVIETMAKYLRSHTAMKTVKNFDNESLLMSLRLFCRPCKRQRVFIASHIFDKYQQNQQRLCQIFHADISKLCQRYEGDSIYNEIVLITPPTHELELYTIYGMKDQGFTFRMVHKTLFYHSYLSSYRL